MFTLAVNPPDVDFPTESLMNSERPPSKCRVRIYNSLQCCCPRRWYFAFPSLRLEVLTFKAQHLLSSAKSALCCGRATGAIAPGKMEDTEEHQVIFYVSGFGPFANVEVNPTNVVVEQYLRAALEARAAHDELLRRVRLATADVLEVSTVGAEDALESVAEEIARRHVPGKTSHVLLHFGLAAGTKSFNIEQMAVNEARFRVPDQRGLQLTDEPVERSEPLFCRRLSPLVTPAIAHELRQLGYAAKPSDDPGRFICNYIYYRSLVLSEQLSSALLKPGRVSSEEDDASPSAAEDQRSSSDERHAQGSLVGNPSVVSLFVHVPYFIEEQGSEESGDAAKRNSNGSAEATTSGGRLPIDKGLGLQAHVGMAVDLIAILARIMLPQSVSLPSIAGSATVALRTESDEVAAMAMTDSSDLDTQACAAPHHGEGGPQAYARRVVSLLPRLAAEFGGSGGFGCSTVAESKANAAATADASAAANGASSYAAMTPAELDAAADLAAKSGDIAAADEMRAVAATKRKAVPTAASTASSADGGSVALSASSESAPSAATSLAQLVLDSVLAAGFTDLQACQRAVIATAPSGVPLPSSTLFSEPSISAAAAAGSTSPPSSAVSAADAETLADWTQRAIEWVLISTESDDAPSTSSSTAPIPSPAPAPAPAAASATTPSVRFDADSLNAALTSALAAAASSSAASAS